MTDYTKSDFQFANDKGETTKPDEKKRTNA